MTNETFYKLAASMHQQAGLPCAYWPANTNSLFNGRKSEIDSRVRIGRNG